MVNGQYSRLTIHELNRHFTNNITLTYRKHEEIKFKPDLRAGKQSAAKKV